MKKEILLLICLGFISLSLTAQDYDRFIMNGNAISIVSRIGDVGPEVSGYMRNGDEVKIYFSQVGVFVDVIHRGKAKNLISAGSFEQEEKTVIEVFEYDFDDDDVNEIIVVESPGIITLNIYVFRYSEGLTELVGRFDGQFEVILSGRVINLPYGSHGLTNTYCYFDGSFYELVLHNPERK